jgi:hypothetical protein
MDGELMAYRRIRASNAMPPGVTPVTGAVGSSTDFARADHTHKTSVQKSRITVSTAGTSTGSVVTWVYPSPFPAGTIPICTCTPVSTGSASQAYIANVVQGSETNSQCQFIVFRTQTQTIVGGLANVVMNLLVPAPAGVVLNCQAALPTATT